VSKLVYFGLFFDFFDPSVMIRNRSFAITESVGRLVQRSVVQLGTSGRRTRGQQHQRLHVITVFLLGCSISLSSIFEPIRNLSYCKSRRLGEFSFFSGTWVRIVLIPVSQDGPRLLLEAVRSLLPVPDCAGQGKLPAHAVLSDRAQRPSTQLLRLNVMRLEPQLLQL